MIKKLCQFVLYKLLGWRIDGDFPEEPKFLYIVIPHTSNWDFVIGYLGVLAETKDLKIFAKDSFFVFPFDRLCKKMGVLPVNRREHTNLVDRIVSMFATEDNLRVVITPEGTRGARDKLKSGYYHIAKKANVPIVLAGFDFPNKRILLTKPRMVKETFEEDQLALVEFAQSVTAKHPEKSIGNTFQS